VNQKKGCKAVNNRLVKVLCIVFASVAMSVSAEPCAYKLGAKHKPGPEITGDYSRPYLYSPVARCWYPDPMYYVAKDALRKWHAMQGCVESKSTGKNQGKRYAKPVEK